MKVTQRRKNFRGSLIKSDTYDAQLDSRDNFSSTENGESEVFQASNSNRVLIKTPPVSNLFQRTPPKLSPVEK